ncbi:uncharacterized protein LOC118490362 [Helianthus annuus]|uniref:uncharacterized protein LOC118490362 n=1 Tax=Helianthus annuus TaxID=4232 RepID=UPI001652F041|nr:uncharacterized protein LOC118490362 [Helianthus annuus]
MGSGKMLAGLNRLWKTGLGRHTNDGNLIFVKFIMTNIAKLEFMALDIIGKNYLSWVLDAEIHLNANNLGETIKEGNKANIQDKVKVMIFLRHHIHEALKSEYLTIKDPLVLWTNLKEMYDHQKTVILPRARYEWINLRLQDFKSISEYNSAMFRITSQLILCGENITDKEMLEKTFLTFHPSNVILQQQYRERGFTKYSELISCLLVAEQNNELLMKNHETRPVGATPIPEANVATYNGQSESYGRGRAKEIETNFTYEVTNVDKDHNDTTNLDYDDFLIEPTNLDSGDIVADTTQLDACNFPYI